MQTVEKSKEGSKTSLLDGIKSTFRNNMRQYAMLIALVVIIIIFQVLTDGVLLYPMNVSNLILQNSYVFILAIGMTLCILTGGNIDLSVGSICAFIGALLGVLIINMKIGVWPAILICLVAGLIIGVWQGFWIAYVRIPAFIVTLAGMLIFRGLTITMLKGLTLSPFPDVFTKISGGYVPDLFKGAMDINLTALLAGIVISVIYVALELKRWIQSKKSEYESKSVYLLIAKLVLVVLSTMLVFYWFASFKGIPVIFVIVGILVLIYSFFANNTVQGRYLYAMGGNEKAAKLSGINTNKVLFLAYVNMAVLSAVASVAFTSRLNAAAPQSGTNFELDAIAACFIGGASAYGGVGTVIGAIIGALVMGVLNNGMSIMGVGSDMQMTIKGLVLLMAVAFDVFSKSKR